MNKILKWLGIVLAGLLGLVVLAALLGYIASEQRLNRSYDVAIETLPLPSAAADLEEGRRLAHIRGCIDCHGQDFGGTTLIEDSMLGSFYAPNLTGGAGSATADFTPEDWARAVRHGIGPDGKALKFMPSIDYAGLSDQDLGRIVAFLQAAPAVDRDTPEITLGPLGRALFLANQIPLLSAELIDHSVRAPRSVTPQVSAAYGAYLATTCTGCHQPDFAGGPVPGSAPGDPPSANLTPSGNLANWTFEDFANTLHTGVTPEGKVLDPAYMPWPVTLEMTDIELEALWLFLSTLAPVEPAA